MHAITLNLMRVHPLHTISDEWILSTVKSTGLVPALQGDVGQAKDGLEAVRKGEELWPDVIVLDIGLPTLHGIEAALLIRHVSPNSKILLLTMESSAEVIEKASSVVAWGYVRKTGAGNELLSAVDALISERSDVVNHWPISRSQFLASSLQVYVPQEAPIRYRALKIAKNHNPNTPKPRERAKRLVYLCFSTP